MTQEKELLIKKASSFQDWRNCECQSQVTKLIHLTDFARINTSLTFHHLMDWNLLQASVDPIKWQIVATV
jgi:hypothetical protein